jgi:hypothetical protein
VQKKPNDIVEQAEPQQRPQRRMVPMSNNNCAPPIALPKIMFPTLNDALIPG